MVSSKGHGRVGRRSTARKSTRHNDNPGSGNPNQVEDPLFNIAYRLAINSSILLNLLSDCTGRDFPEDQNVWLRPFKYLVAYETEIRKALQDGEVAFDQLEARSKPLNQTDITSTRNDVSNPDPKPMQEDGEVSTGGAKVAPHINSLDPSCAKAERDQLRCLVEFMETDMRDIFDVKRQVASQTLTEFAFEHLWLLYKPGDLVYTMKSPEDISTYQAYRVLHVTGGRTILDIVNASRFHAIHDRSWEEESDTEPKVGDAIRGSPSNMTPFIVDCFHIEFDGNRLGPKPRRFVIPTYTGKRKVDSLEVCPYFCYPQHEKIHRTLVERGRRFTQLANGTHKQYSGTTLRESRELWGSAHDSNYIMHEENVFDPSTTYHFSLVFARAADLF